MGSQSSPHVIIIPVGAPGHAIPIVHFAKYLAAQKVTISFVTSDRQNSEIKDSLGTLDFTSQGLPLRFLNLRDGNAHLSHRDFATAIRDSREEEERIVRLLEELIIDLRSPDAQRLRGVAPASPPLAILHDMFVTTWCQKACDKLFLEKHLLFVSPTASLAVMFQSKRLHEEGAIPITAENCDSVLSSIPGLPPTRVMDLPLSMKDPSFDKWARLNHYGFAKSKVILCNTFYALEKPVLDAFRNEVVGTEGVETEHILDIGPLLPDDHLSDDATPAQLAQEEKDPCILFLNTQSHSSVIFISFGSAATVSAPQLLDIAAGLEASNQPFLWLLRPPGAPEVSSASGPPPSISEFLPPGFEERTKGRGLCHSGWAPQMRILKHPAVGGFLSHCGWNSILESVCTGIPFLTWPMGAEQHLNTRFLVDTVKMGLDFQKEPLPKEEAENQVVNQQLPVSKEEIERKVRSLMQGDEGRSVRENTRKMRLNAQKAVAERGSSRTNFEAYVQLLCTKVSLANQVNK